jgi:hypothetical protein
MWAHTLELAGGTKAQQGSRNRDGSGTSAAP